jgi:uncharacterized damage-inducible protein DinB
MKWLVIAGLIVVAIPCTLVLWLLVHRAMERCYLAHAARYCRKRGLNWVRARIGPEFDDEGVKTEFTVIELDCRDAQGERQLVRLQVWLFGVRRDISREKIMDLLDRLLGHDAWTTQQLLLRCRELTDEQLDRDFDLGHRTVRATLLHMIGNMEVWSDLMSGVTVRRDNGMSAESRTVEGMIVRLEAAAADLRRVARPVADREGWDEQWIDRLDDPPRAKTFGGGIAHIITHSVHHRAHLLYMLHRLGVSDLPEGDVFNWEQRAKSS